MIRSLIGMLKLDWSTWRDWKENISAFYFVYRYNLSSQDCYDMGFMVGNGIPVKTAFKLLSFRDFV